MFPEVLIPKSMTVTEAMGPMRNTQHLTVASTEDCKKSHRMALCFDQTSTLGCNITSSLSGVLV